MRRSDNVLPHNHRVPPPTRPGEVLEREWLEPARISQTALAAKMGVHVKVVNGIVQGRRAVTAKTALLLSRSLGTTPEFWLNLQNACDLWDASGQLAREKRVAAR